MRHAPLMLTALILGMAGALRAQDMDAGAYLAANFAQSQSDFRSADDWYSRALKIDPKNPAILGNAMVTALSLGDVARSADMARALTKLGVQSQNIALAQLADRAMQADYARILADQKGGASVGALMDQLAAAWANVGLGQMSDALALFDKIIATPGIGGFGLYHKALALAQAGDFDGAAQIFAGKSGKFNLSRRGVIAYAKVLSQLERGAEAAVMLEQGFNPANDPEIKDLIEHLRGGQALPLAGLMDAKDGLAESLLGLAGALDQENDDGFALMHARAALALRPQDAETILLTASLLMKLNQSDFAAQIYGMIPKTDPAFRDAEIGRAGAEFDADRPDAAVKILSDLAAANPTDADVLLALGNGQRRVKSFDAAVKTYDATIALLPPPNPNHWPVYFGRGVSYQELGKFDLAESDMRMALKLSPDQADVLNYLGYSLVDRGIKLDEALGMIQRAVAARPESGFIVDSLAWAYFRLGKYADALPPMEQASLLEPVDPIVTDHLGDVYWANDRKREAEFQWRRALSYEPTEKDAARIRKKLELGLDAVLAAEGAAPLVKSAHD